MALEIKRLHLASLQASDGSRWPVHGFVITHRDALAELELSPAGIGLVINTHLHFDHCGQMRREATELYEWFGFMNARFELLDGDAEVLPGLEVVATPGRTEGHQCVVVRGDDGRSNRAFLPPHRHRAQLRRPSWI